MELACRGYRRKRISLLCALLAAAALGLTFGGCGKRTPPPPVDVAPPPSTGADASPGPEAVKVALILPGMITDMSWNTGAYQGLKAAAKETGVTFAYQQKVADADVERALRDYAQKGYELILAESFNYGAVVLRVAKDFPQTHFATATHFETAKNVAFYDWPAHHAGYLAGMLAASMTKSSKIGFVGGFEVPDIIRIAEAYKLGAKAVDAKVVVKALYTGSWEETARGTACAETLLDWGADVIAQGADGPGVGAMKKAAERGAWAIGYVADQKHVAPSKVLTSIVLNKRLAYVTMIRDVQSGKFEGRRYLFDMVAGGVQMAPYTHVPPEVAARIEKARKEILAGKIAVRNIEKSTK